MGFKITNEGIKPETEKVNTIRSLLQPVTVKEVRSFVGMDVELLQACQIFSQFLLVELTKKYAKFKWTDECQKAFEYFKDSLTVIPSLAYPDLTKPHTPYTDASGDTIGDEDMEGGGRPSKRRKVETGMTNLQIESC